MLRRSNLIKEAHHFRGGSRSVLMVRAPVSGSSSPGSSKGQGHCVMVLGKTRHSHNASLHPSV